MHTPRKSVHKEGYPIYSFTQTSTKLLHSNLCSWQNHRTGFFLYWDGGSNTHLLWRCWLLKSVGELLKRIYTTNFDTSKQKRRESILLTICCKAPNKWSQIQSAHKIWHHVSSLRVTHVDLSSEISHQISLEAQSRHPLTYFSSWRKTPIHTTTGNTRLLYCLQINITNIPSWHFSNQSSILSINFRNIFPQAKN
jgi:hypothetical protein